MSSHPREESPISCRLSSQNEQPESQHDQNWRMLKKRLSQCEHGMTNHHRTKTIAAAFLNEQRMSLGMNISMEDLLHSSSSHSLPNKKDKCIFDSIKDSVQTATSGMMKASSMPDVARNRGATPSVYPDDKSTQNSVWEMDSSMKLLHAPGSGKATQGRHEDGRQSWGRRGSINSMTSSMKLLHKKELNHAPGSGKATQGSHEDGRQSWGRRGSIHSMTSNDGDRKGFWKRNSCIRSFDSSDCDHESHLSQNMAALSLVRQDSVEHLFSDSSRCSSTAATSQVTDEASVADAPGKSNFRIKISEVQGEGCLVDISSEGEGTYDAEELSLVDDQEQSFRLLS